MKRIRVDFLIVGAGLAGSVAGFLLKKAGADVLALELGVWRRLHGCIAAYAYRKSMGPVCRA